LILSSVSKYKIAKLPAPEVAWVKFKEHNIHLPLTTDEHSAPRPSNQPYRPALDGLRALAILPVLVFHLKASWFPGGFVGVDVFFVISGYLITNLILRECERGDFSFRRFYQRRIARLFPSMALVLAISAGAILMLYDQRMIGDNGPHMAESVLSVANIFSAHEENGYFGITKDAHPFLHFWSLSVEEQFYVFFPMTFLFLWRWGRRRLNFSLASLLILSLAYCVWKTRVNQSWSFYMLPTRAWELLAGALAATTIPAQMERLGRSRGAFAWTGAVLLLVSLGFVRSTHFPGAIAIFPVLGAVCVIIGCSGDNNSVNGFFSHPLLVRIGQLSYVLYLWHLPIFCMVDYRLLLTPEWERTTLKCVLTLAATLLTSYYVENPARRWLNRREHQREAFAFALGVLISFVPLGIWERVYDYPEPKASMVARGGLSFNRGGSRGSIAIIGDSQACATSTTLRAIAVEQGFQFDSMCVSSSMPLMGAPGEAWSNTLAGVKRVRPDVLVIELEWVDREQLTQRLTDTLQALAPYTHRIVLLTEYPILEPGMPREALRDGLRLPFFEATQRKTRREHSNDIVRAVAQNLHVTLVDTAAAFTQPDGSVRILNARQRPLYNDWMHASSLGVDAYKAALSDAISHSNYEPASARAE
jgi:peptidoglycan/LPS O-acetylase OafA/YrhL